MRAAQEQNSCPARNQQECGASTAAARGRPAPERVATHAAVWPVWRKGRRVGVVSRLRLLHVQATPMARLLSPIPSFAAFAMWAGAVAAQPLLEPRTEPQQDFWDPPVVTAAGLYQPLSESPSTTFVITAEEIRHSGATSRSEEHTSELQSRENLVCRLL